MQITKLFKILKKKPHTIKCIPAHAKLQITLKFYVFSFNQDLNKIGQEIQGLHKYFYDYLALSYLCSQNRFFCSSLTGLPVSVKYILHNDISQHPPTVSIFSTLCYSLLAVLQTKMQHKAKTLSKF